VTAVYGNGIEIRASRKESGEAQKRPAAALFFLTAGMLGVLSFFHSLKGISFPAGVVCPVTAALCWLTWYIYYGKKKYFLLYAFLFAAACWLAVLFMGETLREQLRVIVECLTERSAEETVSVTETAVLLAALLTFFVAMGEFLLKSHEVLYLLTMVLMLLSPLLGIRTGIAAMLLLALFQTAFQAVQTVLSVGGRTMLGGVRKQSLSEKSGIAAAAVLAGTFLIVYPAVPFCLNRLYACAYDAEGQVCRALLCISGRAAEPVSGGRVSRGNNYPTGTAQLEVLTSEQIREPLYLRGFSGGEYVGGGWTGSNDEVLLEEIKEKMNWQGWENTISTRFNNMYYLLTQNLLQDPSPKPFSVNIRHYGGAFDNIYVPYYSARSRRYLYDEWDDFWYDYGYGNTREGYVYQCYEQPDVKVDWDGYRSNFASERDWFRAMQDAYMEEIRTAYTAVPVKILPRLAGLCQENPQGSLDEVTAFIVSTLHSRASYTLTPGWAPLNEDIAEYFLFEGGRGYCEHFATTAALMYRLYGVPARYAAGYMLSPDDFTQQEDGRWKAAATDEDAHAWVEIFVEDYGWTPVEVTPARDGSIPVSYPGLDGRVISRMMEEYGWQENQDIFPQEAGSSDFSGNEDVWLFPELSEIDWDRYGKPLAAIGACAVYSLCLLPLFLDYRRLRKLKKMETAGCRKVFSRLLLMLRSEGIFEGYDGTEEDFAEALGRAVSLPEEDVARMQEIVSGAAYGEGAVKPEEEAYVRQMYGRLAQAVCGKLKWYRRLVFRYWKGFY